MKTLLKILALLLLSFTAVAALYTLLQKWGLQNPLRRYVSYEEPDPDAPWRT